MRIDLYLKLMGITKTRMAAKRLCDGGRVLVAGRRVKPSHEVLPGECLDLDLPPRRMKLTVLSVPIGVSVPKRERPSFMVLEVLGG